MRTISAPVLHGIVVNVITVPLEISVVPDGVFPEASLPHPSSAIALLRPTHRPLDAGGAQPGLREFLLEIAPPRREIMVAVRQGPDCMNVIRQEDDRVNIEGPACLCSPNGTAESIPCYRRAEDRRPIEGDDREEEGAARNKGSPVFRHGVFLRIVGSAVRTNPSYPPFGPHRTVAE